MSTHYRLQPPFLYVAEQQDFSNAWEHFCCKLLNIDNKTTEIYVRNPPEQGVDIFFPSKNIAYQCKSVESGKPGDFNVTKAIESINAAISIQSQLGWTEYVLCTNVMISGTAEEKLKIALPKIKILSFSYWVQLCQTHVVEVERNFRKILEIPPPRVLSAINTRFMDHYSEQLTQKLKGNSFDIFLYSNQHDTTYRIAVSSDFTINDLLIVFREIFNLPESAEIKSEDIRVSLRHSVIFKGEIVPLIKTIQDAGISQGDIITYCTRIIWEDLQKKFDGTVLHLAALDIFNRSSRGKYERRDVAISEFKEILKKSFIKLDDTL